MSKTDDQIDPARERGDTKQRLMAAAAELVAEQGWGQVTTRAVAARAGVNPGVVHYHFDSVDDLLRQSAMAAAVELFEDSIAAVEDIPDVAAGVQALVGQLAAFDLAEPGMLLLYEAGLASVRDERMGAEFAAMMASYRRRLTRWLESGGIPDAEARATLLAALVDGLVLHRAIDPAMTLEGLAGPLARLVAGNGGSDK